MDTEKRKFSFKRLMKYLVLIIAALVYLIFFARLFETRDPKLAETVYLTAEESAVFKNLDEDFSLYHYQPVSWTAEDGSVTVTNIHYLEDLSKLQLTVRHRSDIYDEGGEYPFTFKLRVTGVEDFETVPVTFVEDRSKYTWTRLCADGILSDHGEEVEVELETFDEEGNSIITTDTEIKGGTEVFLDIFNLDGERLYTFELAGKDVDRARIRRTKVEVSVID
ncbi:MAG: hypothetical protein IJP16_06415 [Clostridia bacterium]|nr:hypothetical protein [Clostridia bacterium]